MKNTTLKSLLKISVATGVLLTGTSWGAAGEWYNSLTGAKISGSDVPTTPTVAYFLTEGDGSTAATTITPADPNATKLTILQAAQTAASTNALVFTPSKASTVYISSAGTAGTNNLINFQLNNATFACTINCSGGHYKFNAASNGGAAGAVTVNVTGNSTFDLATEALNWNYVVASGVTATVTATSTPLGGNWSGPGSIITGTAATTIKLK
jgi:hypothetical protein